MRKSIYEILSEDSFGTEDITNKYCRDTDIYKLLLSHAEGGGDLNSFKIDLRSRFESDGVKNNPIAIYNLGVIDESCNDLKSMTSKELIDKLPDIISMCEEGVAPRRRPVDMPPIIPIPRPSLRSKLASPILRYLDRPPFGFGVIFENREERLSVYQNNLFFFFGLDKTKEIDKNAKYRLQELFNLASQSFMYKKTFFLKYLRLREQSNGDEQVFRDLLNSAEEFSKSNYLSMLEVEKMYKEENGELLF